MSKLTAKIGAMNCGKSSRLIQTAYNYTEQGLVVVTTMPSLAERKPNWITARDGVEWPNNIPTTTDTDLEQDLDRYIKRHKIATVHCILADEVNFNTPEQVEALWRIAKRRNISVIAHALKSNIQTHLFDGTRRLIELADHFQKIETMCSCGSQAEFNARYVDGKFHVGDPIVMIDNNPERIRYQSMCGNCYFEAIDS